MQYIKTNEFSLSDTAVALGKFEGLHRGHQLLFQEIVKQKEQGLQSVVFTFDMPPRQLFHKEESKKQLYTKEERCHILKKYGVDILIEYPFTLEFASLSPEEFIKNVLVEQVGAKVVVVGDDFRFGKKRAGSVEDLQKYASVYGYELKIIKKLQQDGHDISSSTIKNMLGQARMSEISELLGRNFSVSGKVMHGKALGRTIQIPTVNQIPEEGKALPPFGVYLSRIHLGNESYYGITNIGVKPTVDQEKICGVETHIFDYSGDLYDQMIEVELLRFCRPEMKFGSLDALVKQMKQDIATAKKLINRQ